MIPAKTVEEILNITRVDDVIEDFVNLKRRGTNMIGLCPFHDEKTPSFIVSPAKGIYKCFGCGKGGTAVNFIMDHESLSYPESLRYLANKYNIAIEEIEINEEDRQARQLSDSLYILNEFAKNYFEEQLFNTDEGKSVGLSYFKERGYRDAIIKKFNLGYAGGDRDQFTKTALNKSFNIDHMKMVGLTSKSDNDFFRSRVMFTIHNLSGKVIAFAGRILTNDKSQPKYINSPESEIYLKRKILYGIFQAKNEIRKLDECLLVEGYTDVLTLHQGGVENVVASSGTSLTSEQIRLIKRFTQNIKIIYDGDAAGIKAALRGLDLALEEDMNVRLVLLPDGEDPDSFMKKEGSDGFREYLVKQEKDFVLFKAELLMKEVGKDPIKRAEAMKDITSSIAKVPDEFKRASYISYTSAMLEIDEKIMVSEIGKAINQMAKSKKIERDRSKFNAPSPEVENSWITTKSEDGVTQIVNPSLFTDEYQERDLARILITGAEKLYEEDDQITVAEYLMVNISEDIDKIEHDLYRKVFEYAKQAYEEGKKITSNLFASHPDISISSLAIDFLVSPYTLADWEAKGIILQTQKVPELNFKRDCYQGVMRFKLKKANKIIETLQKDLQSNPEMSEDDKILHLKIIQQYTKERNEIAKELNNVILN